MASFLTSLWESVFTPGPTPTLLLATNVTFGVLQVLLLILLVATQSIHFIVLSILCAGLWYAINWFAAEVQAAQVKEEAEKKDKDRATKRLSPDPGSASDTETETEPKGHSSGATAAPQKVERRKAAPKTKPADPPSKDSSQETAGEAGVSSGLLRPDTPGSAGKGMGDSDLLQRRRSVGESSGYISTDSEWEKVSDQEDKK